MGSKKFEIADIVICNDMIGFVTDVTDRDVTIRDKDDRYRTVSINNKGLGLICNAYAQCACVYKNLMGGTE